MENIKQTVEAIIFASGSEISKSDLCEKFPALTLTELNSVVKDLQKTYSHDNGILLIEVNGKLQFTSNPKYGETVADILTPLREKELTKTLLEVLSTIAYKQPITRLEIDDMRGGTNSEYALSALLKAGLIEAVGRKEAVGRPFMYGTTDAFLKKFQLTALDELPDLDEVLEKIKLIYTPSDGNLFHSRTLYDADGNLIEATANMSEFDRLALERGVLTDAEIDALVAADIEKHKNESAAANDIFDDDDEIPDFLKDETYQVID